MFDGKNTMPIYIINMINISISRNINISFYNPRKMQMTWMKSMIVKKNTQQNHPPKSRISPKSPYFPRIFPIFSWGKWGDFHHCYWRRPGHKATGPGRSIRHTGTTRERSGRRPDLTKLRTGSVATSTKMTKSGKPWILQYICIDIYILCMYLFIYLSIYLFI